MFIISLFDLLPNIRILLLHLEYNTLFVTEIKNDDFKCK